MPPHQISPRDLLHCLHYASARRQPCGVSPEASQILLIHWADKDTAAVKAAERAIRETRTDSGARDWRGTRFLALHTERISHHRVESRECLENDSGTVFPERRGPVVDSLPENFR